MGSVIFKYYSRLGGTVMFRSCSQFSVRKASNYNFATYPSYHMYPVDIILVSVFRAVFFSILTNPKIVSNHFYHIKILRKLLRHNCTSHPKLTNLQFYTFSFCLTPNIEHSLVCLFVSLLFHCRLHLFQMFSWWLFCHKLTKNWKWSKLFIFLTAKNWGR